jgi:hypothetical protein
MDNYGAKLKGKKNVTLLPDKLEQFIAKFIHQDIRIF